MVSPTRISARQVDTRATPSLRIAAPRGQPREFARRRSSGHARQPLSLHAVGRLSAYAIRWLRGRERERLRDQMRDGRSGNAGQQLNEPAPRRLRADARRRLTEHERGGLRGRTRQLLSEPARAPLSRQARERRRQQQCLRGDSQRRPPLIMRPSNDEARVHQGMVRAAPHARVLVSRRAGVDARTGPAPRAA